MIETIINEQNTNQKIDKLIRRWLNQAPLSFIYRLFRKKDIKVNGKWVKSDYVLQIGDVVSVYINAQQEMDFIQPIEVTKVPLKYQIIYEDEQCLIINKPKGLLVHQGNNEKTNTLTNDVLNYLAYQGINFSLGSSFITGPVHRLDRNTSGLIVYAKTSEAAQLFSHIFKERNKVSKHYLALVVGHISKGGIIELPLLKDEKSNKTEVSYLDKAQSAVSKYQVIKTFKQFTLLKIEIITGRYHQIRAHLQAINHPIVGDKKYGDEKINAYFKNNFNYEYQFLHAYELLFKQLNNPLEKLSNQTFIAPLSEQEENILSLLM